MSFLKTVTPRVKEAYSDDLVRRIRQFLAYLPNVVEKKMFNGLSFIVDERMCISVGRTGVMLRVDPAVHDDALTRKGCSTVAMQGKEYKGWIRVTEEGMKSRQDFEHWVRLSLAFNVKAQESQKPE